jgi:uncharacterized membrane protein AbrB (regulator of aidB expression)
MEEKNRQLQEDETPTMKKLRALVRQVGTGVIAYETVIPQALLTILLVGGAVYMVITGQDVPDWLIAAAGSIIGFYFGSDYEFRRLTGKASKHG